MKLQHLIHYNIVFVVIIFFAKVLGGGVYTCTLIRLHSDIQPSSHHSDLVSL